MIKIISNRKALGFEDVTIEKVLITRSLWKIQTDILEKVDRGCRPRREEERGRRLNLGLGAINGEAITKTVPGTFYMFSRGT